MGTGDDRRVRAIEELLALYPEWRSSDEDDARRVRMFLRASVGVEPAVYEQACRRIVATRQREQGRPTPGDVQAVVARLVQDARRYDRPQRSIPELRGEVMAEIRSGKRRLYAETVLNPGLAAAGLPVLELPAWWPEGDAESRARWSRENAEPAEWFSELCQEHPAMARTIAALIVPHFDRKPGSRNAAL